jgi:pimeloyl-ACP methyl ester carboxylesterase
MSFGAAVGIHLAARYPRRVRSLSLHSGWHATDDYLKIVIEQWRTLASTLPTVADVVIQAIFPWCFTPEMYVERPEFVDTLVDFGARDLVCSTRFAEPLKNGIAGSELTVFEHLSHAGLHEDPETFNRATLDFLLRQRS